MTMPSTSKLCEIINLKHDITTIYATLQQWRESKVSTRHCDYQSTSPSQDTTNHPMQSVQLPAHKMLIQTKHNTRDGSICQKYCDILPISILSAVMKVSQNATKCRSGACKNRRKYSGAQHCQNPHQNSRSWAARLQLQFPTLYFRLRLHASRAPDLQCLGAYCATPHPLRDGKKALWSITIRNPGFQVWELLLYVFTFTLIHTLGSKCFQICMKVISVNWFKNAM